MLNYGTSLNTILPSSALSSTTPQFFLRRSMPRSCRTLCNTALRKLLCTKHYQSFTFKTAIFVAERCSRTVCILSGSDEQHRGLPAPCQLSPTREKSAHRSANSCSSARRAPLKYSQKCSRACWRGRHIPDPTHAPAAARRAAGTAGAGAEGDGLCVTNGSRTRSPENAPPQRKGGFARRLFPTKATFYSFKAFGEFVSN